MAPDEESNGAGVAEGGEAGALAELSEVKARLEKREAECAALSKEVEQSKGETLAVRKKLHNAIRKGKAIEAARKEQESEVAALTARLEEGASGGSGEGAEEAKAAKEAVASLERELAEAREGVALWKGKAEEGDRKLAAFAESGAAGGQDAGAGEEVERLRKEKRSLEQKLKLEAAMKEGQQKEFESQVEAKEAEAARLRQEMATLQSAVRSAAERVADATAAESRASEERESSKAQAAALQRRVAELEGQLNVAGSAEEDKQRVLNESLNLRKEKDELESGKLLLENDVKTKQELLVSS